MVLLEIREFRVIPLRQSGFSHLKLDVENDVD